MQRQKVRRTDFRRRHVRAKWCVAQMRVNSNAARRYFSRRGAFNFRCPIPAVPFGFRMQGKSQRLVELDFFRGLVLLVIAVDHIGGSMLSRVTLHAFALNDAAEVFVFLGGFATATAYAGVAARRSESAARARFFPPRDRDLPSVPSHRRPDAGDKFRAAAIFR